MAYSEIYFTGTQWVIRDGDIYVSSIGDDTSGVGDPLRPFATVQKAITIAGNGDRIVVGNGTYNGELDGAGKDLLILGDGFVELKAEYPSETLLSNFGNSTKISGLRVRSYSVFSNGAFSSIENCDIESAHIENFVGIISYCVLKSLTIKAVSSSQLIKCTLLNVQTGSDAAAENRIATILDTHIGAGSVLDLNSSITTQFDYCNQEAGSTVKVDGTSFSSHTALNSSFGQFQDHGISVSPFFNDPLNNDYSLQLNSPLAKAGRFDRYIGALGEANAYRRSNMGNVSLSNVTIDADGRFKLIDTFTDGNILIRLINLGKKRALGKITLFGEQIFETPPVNAVADLNPVKRVPNAITFEMKYADTQGQLNNPNNKFKEFMWNQIPLVDRLGRGNGDVLFESNSAREITARMLQVRITLHRSVDTEYLVQENTYCLLQENGSNLIWSY